MIQFSAAPASKLPSLPDLPGEIGAALTISAEFATLLAAQSGEDAPAPAAISAETFAQPAKVQALTGKPGGKVLPLPILPAVTPVTEEPSVSASKLQTGADSTGLADKNPDAPDVTLLQPLLQLQPPLPPVQPLPGPDAAPLPVPLAAPLAAAAIAAPVLRKAGASPEAAAQQLPAGPAAAIALAPPPSRPQGDWPATAIVADRPQPVVAKEAIEIRLPLLTAAALAAPRNPDAPVAPQPVAVSADTATAVRQQAAVQAVAPGQIAQAQPKPGRAKAEQRAAALSSAQATDPVSPGREAAADLAPAPVSSAQAILAMPQDQGAPAAAPASASAQHRGEAPADFSTLIDRLVTAREAAQASLAPQAVHAAITHAEFGHVSLRFEHQDGSLNVAMASADPDFTRSVLAAAPASQQGAENSDNRGSSGRQDTGQATAQPQAQAHSQTQGQAAGHNAQRGPAQPPQSDQQHRQPAETASASPNTEAAPDRRRGIFA